VTRLEISQSFTAPVERVYAHLAHHENLAEVFGAPITRVRDGDTEPDGVGSVREIKQPVVPPVQETVTAAVPNERIEYRITKNGSPLKDHRAVMLFRPEGTGSRLDWTIEFGSTFPGAGAVVGAMLRSTIRKGLKKLAREL
jgi:uncharacterized protein YndB with AHSA1/START domain